jgi:hypothetical protein
MNNAAPQEDTVEVPDEVLVACPLAAFAMTRVSKCPDCKVFGGLEDRFPGGKMEFHRRYLLKCFGEPMRRTMVVLAKG